MFVLFWLFPGKTWSPSFSLGVVLYGFRNLFISSGSNVIASADDVLPMKSEKKKTIKNNLILLSCLNRGSEVEDLFEIGGIDILEKKLIKQCLLDEDGVWNIFKKWNI